MLSSGDPGYVIEPMKQPVNKKKKTELSAGCYAGIACGFVFFLVIVAFIINGIRKRWVFHTGDRFANTSFLYFQVFFYTFANLIYIQTKREIPRNKVCKRFSEKSENRLQTLFLGISRLVWMEIQFTNV